jgi:putative FmdB family regulatory protein
LPIYEYECPSCSCRFEQKRSFTDDSPAICPKCKKESRRVFSPVPIIFKGSGFYVTDHKGNPGHSASSVNHEQTEPVANHEHSESKDNTKSEVATAKTVRDLAKKK